ncbi:MAG TPA: CapA family protein [Petrimonas sp.]|uniref:CapA family protein n=1 Tax=Petrimonas sp. TaxID=2023866 RepID=UPI00175CEAAC|nr:CapA family protein [Petrimonas sp.]HHV87240.1 CapA family protein [Petrimonas sp.]
MRFIVSTLFLLLVFLFSQAQEKRVTLLFAGDAMQHLPQIHAAQTEEGYNYDSCFYLLKGKISSADIACVNFETTLGGKPYTGYPQFSAPDEFAFGLKEAGFDVFFLANNHTVDKGRRGVERTLSVLDSIGIKHTGVFRSRNTRGLNYPLMIIKNGIRIAFLNYTYDTNGLPVIAPNIVNIIDTLQMKSDLRLTQLYNPDIVIANMHWGDEYKTYPNSGQEKLARFLFRNGVRIIIGNHPHVVQPLVKNKVHSEIESVVYYSLGNFISNQQTINTDGGALAEIVITKADDGSPVKIRSCSYSLVWVRKYTENGKLKYMLIPVEEQRKTVIPVLTSQELQKINIFATNADKIIASF